MDTGLAMASLALLLFVWSRHASLVSGREPAPNRIWIVLASWIAFGVRPDLGLYSLGIPLVICVLAPASRRLGYALTALASAAAVALLLAWAWWYFGAPLTLSFYAKAMKAGYGPDFVRTHAPVAGQQLLLFAVFYAPLWIVALIDLPTRWRGARESENSLWLGVFAATLLHWIYYRFAVMQVVGAWQRFYYPTLPALMLLGATSAARMFASWQLRNSDAAAGKRLVYSGFALCSVVCALSLALPYSWMMRVLPSILAPYSRQFESATDMLRKEAGSGQLVNFSMEERYVSTKARSFWFALDGFSKLPDDLAIATTEVGLPAAMNPGKRIIDIAGLNENSFARHGFDARHLCEDLIPDVIYLPHPDYTTLIEALMKEPSFLREYELYPKQELHSFMDLALRRNSAYFESMRAIVAARRAENAPSGTRQAR